LSPKLLAQRFPTQCSLAEAGDDLRGRPSFSAAIQSKAQHIVDKKFQDSGHMITIGLNFHF